MKNISARLSVVLVTIIMVMLVMPTVAMGDTYSNYMVITITDNSTTATYTYLPILASINNSQLNTLGYINSTGLDTDLQEGATSRSYMVAQPKLGIYAGNFSIGQKRTFYYRLGDSPGQSTTKFLTGIGGNVTVLNSTSLQHSAANMTIQQSGFVETTVGTAKYLTYKNGAFATQITGGTNITTGYQSLNAINITTPTIGAWTDVDVSAYIPVGATGVLLDAKNIGTAACTAGYRKNGSGDNRIGTMFHNSVMVGVDNARTFEMYRGEAGDLAYLTGYTQGDWVFNTNATDISIATTLAWVPISLSAIAPNAVGVVIEINNNGGGADDVGLRKGGSTDARINPMYSTDDHVFAYVGLNSTGYLEGYIDAATIDFWLVGYVTAGATFVTNGVDKSLGGVGSFLDIDVSAAGSLATNSHFAFIEGVDTAGNNSGIRENGSTDSILETFYKHGWYIAPMDDNKVFEAQIANVSTDFYYLGTASSIYPIYTKKVEATGISSGVMTVETVANTGGNIDLYVGGVLKGSTATAGASMPVTANKWHLGLGDAMRYWSYFRMMVTGAETILLQPTSMFAATNLPDMTGSGNTGTVNWGANPSGMEVLVGTVSPFSAFTASSTDTAEIIPDVIPKPNADVMFQEPAPAAVDLPFYDSVSAAATGYGYTVGIMYSIIVIILGVCFGFAGMLAVGGIWGFLVGFGLIAGMGASMGIMGAWIILAVDALVGLVLLAHRTT